MNKGRLEAFTDGVVAIIITIMVLEMKVPHGTDISALCESLPVFFAYVLSYINVGLFWNNHHHMMHAAAKIDGRALWANLFLLFWLSLVPFVIRWIDEGGFTALPVAGYGVVLAMAGLGYMLLERLLIACNGGSRSVLAKALGKDYKTWLSLFCYTAGIGLAFVNVWISIVLYVFIAAIWLVPDRRIEKLIKD